jgi:uncharacterized membrane protein
MDKNIGVGMIVGLAMVSFLYVLNSDSFTKSQKAVILTLIIFPPAHWFVLIAVLIYNNNFTKDAVETNKVIKEVEKINESKTTLEQLKQKGILTEEEFNKKVEQLNIEENEKALKNSTEYKQLKSLLDNGILTKEEFEEKVKLIKSDNSLDKNQTIDETKEDDFKNNDNTKINSNKNDYFLAFILICILVVVLLAIYTNVKEQKNLEKTDYEEFDNVIENSSINNELPLESNSNNTEYIQQINYDYFIYCSVYYKRYNVHSQDGYLTPILTEEGKYCSQIVEISENEIPKFNERFRNDFTFKSSIDEYGVKIDRQTFKINKFNSYEEALDSKNKECVSDLEVLYIKSKY